MPTELIEPAVALGAAGRPTGLEHDGRRPTPPPRPCPRARGLWLPRMLAASSRAGVMALPHLHADGPPSLHADHVGVPRVLAQLFALVEELLGGKASAIPLPGAAGVVGSVGAGAEGALGAAGASTSRERFLGLALFGIGRGLWVVHVHRSDG